jgi:hypothetical protein
MAGVLPVSMELEPDSIEHDSENLFPFFEIMHN